MRELKECSNRRLLIRQQETLEKRAAPGERLARHPITKHAIYVCTRCGKPGHQAGACVATPASDEPVAAGGGADLPPRGPVPECWLCGALPFALGLDVSSKVCMGLSRDVIRGRLDYSLPPEFLEREECDGCDDGSLPLLPDGVDAEE